MVFSAESGSLEVINLCTAQVQWFDLAAAIYAKCLDVANMIGKVKFRNCKREANGASHELVRVSYLNKLSYKWVDDPPDWILSVLENGVIVFKLIKIAMMVFP